ncbi:nitronate monooxygenase [Peribacillus asahii]|uniref:nitronate monooxygenase n=1 Tax=Peribacillus asahii TaxID=228899 RepID=UPI00382631D8
MRASFALGAEGVYVGTRFIVSEECPASDKKKEDIISTKAKDLVFVSSTQRSTPHRFDHFPPMLFKNCARLLKIFTTFLVSLTHNFSTIRNFTLLNISKRKITILTFNSPNVVPFHFIILITNQIRHKENNYFRIELISIFWLMERK